MFDPQTIDLLQREHDRSLELHGDWSDLTIEQMDAAIMREQHECDMAYAHNDIDGVHGLIVEDIQAANVHLKRAAELIRRRWQCQTTTPS